MAGAFPPEKNVGLYLPPGDPMPPPPCYESVVGAHTLIGFQDFWPKCVNNADKAKHAVFEDFK